MYQENLSIASRYFILHMERKEGGREREKDREGGRESMCVRERESVRRG